MTRHFEHIAHDRARRRTSARAFTEEHGLAYGIADHVDRVVNAIDLCKLMIERNHSGVNTHVDTVIGAMSMRNELHGIAHGVRHGQVDRRNAADAFGVDIVHDHARVERDRSQNGDLRCCIVTIDIGRGISFCKAFGLGFSECFIVAHAVFAHAGEHVVRRAVHDAHDRRDLVSDQRVLQRTDDRDTATNACLERQLNALFFRERHDLFA